MGWTSIHPSENLMMMPETSCFGAAARPHSVRIHKQERIFLPDVQAMGRCIRPFGATFTETTSERTRTRLLSYMTDEPCLSCNGSKLNPAVRGVIVGSFTTFHASTARAFLKRLQSHKSGQLGNWIPPFGKKSVGPPPTSQIFGC